MRNLPHFLADASANRERSRCQPLVVTAHESKSRESNMKKTCELCHGTGQRCYFKGESRFILSQDECPGCCGMGYVDDEVSDANRPDGTTFEDDTSPET